MKKGPCRVCGQKDCSCEEVLSVIREEAPDTETERRRVEKFRSQVRNEARKFKRGLI